jgi:beta-galactosidase
VHTRPVIMCEYAHAMGNSTGNMDEYWDVIRSTDGLQGGFVWDWMDQGLVMKDAKTGEDYWAYGGDCGETVHDGNFNINGLVFPDQNPHPGMEQCKYVHQPVTFSNAGWRVQGASPSNPKAPIENKASVRVLNRYDFSTLSHLHLKWRFEVDGQVVASGVAPLPQVGPETLNPQS